jgi:hypothetical protein
MISRFSELRFTSGKKRGGDDLISVRKGDKDRSWESQRSLSDNQQPQGSSDVFTCSLKELAVNARTGYRIALGRHFENNAISIIAAHIRRPVQLAVLQNGITERVHAIITAGEGIEQRVVPSAA